ncbi:hypothetical protein SUGI_0810770 [Cryptomeria japonica]|uniref:protein NRT1/ PTR FAMILY 8.3 n=1 Tax=Cryptomeria japonica TaxID=3369 RepID=UPI00241491D1|nr:protein NRT1/ PTR FAMILY 8.3 [Cryptomeria japonica]GLJ39658.1 hypothetical protein SUGI_0810770 [Cryptomeria japonica]
MGNDEEQSLEVGLLEVEHEQILHHQEEEESQNTGDGSIDIHGKPTVRQNTGGWRACFFILGIECCEQLAYFGISINLVTYLTTVLHQGNATAAKNATIWSGTCYLTALLGAVLADAYWGRYWTIAVFSSIYFVGMATLTVSASVSILQPSSCTGDVCPTATTLQSAVFLLGLYLVALGTGGIRPCVSSFGADQFDDTNPTERKKKGSFFNWFYFSVNVGALVSSSILVWVQDNVGWGWGIGIPTAFMALAIGCFLLGAPLYRFQKPGGSPLTRICQVVVASLRKLQNKVPQESSLLYEIKDKHSAIQGSRKLKHTNDFHFLDKAAIITYEDVQSGGISNPWKLCTVTQVEELKILVRLIPIWVTGIVFSAVYAQMSTMFVEQGMIMDTSIGSFRIPPASLSIFDILSVMIWIPVYDGLIVPIVHKYTGNERGFTPLQRMGIGLVVSILSMAVAAWIEIKRLDTVTTHDMVPMSILWQIPQYFLIGAAEVFFVIGQLEFFYDQSPDAMRSLCNALTLLTASLGNYLSTLILTIVTYVTAQGGEPGWLPDNLNEGHLDYFFWVLASLSSLNMLMYVACVHRFSYKRAT